MSFYAVRIGRNPGVYESWSECNTEVDDFPKAKYKKFPTQAEALAFVDGKDAGGSAKKEEKPDSKKRKSDGKEKGDGDEENGDVKAKKTKDDDNWTGTPFDVGGDDVVSVYTNGTCFYNGKKGQVAGMGVYWAEDDDNNLSKPLGGTLTKNRAEINAAYEAVKLAKKREISNLILHTDCQYLINCASKWVSGWKKKDWKTAAGEPVSNKEDIQKLDGELTGINIKWVHVATKGTAEKDATNKLAVAGGKLPVE